MSSAYKYGRRLFTLTSRNNSAVLSPVSIQTQSLALRALCALRKRKPQETQAISRNKRKRQPIGMLGQSSGNHDWLLANASACVSCAFVYATHAKQAIAFEWKPGFMRNNIGPTTDPCCSPHITRTSAVGCWMCCQVNGQPSTHTILLTILAYFVIRRRIMRFNFMIAAKCFTQYFAGLAFSHPNSSNGSTDDVRWTRS